MVETDIVFFILTIVTILLSALHCPNNIVLIPAYVWSKLMRWGLFFIMWLNIKVIGKDFRGINNCIYVCKHQSAWETIILHGLLFNICFVLKEELTKIPLFGSGLKAVKSIPIQREKNINSFKKILRIGKKNIASKINIVIFPEGTRVDVGTYPKFHKTAIQLAKLTKSKIIPIAHNSGLFWPNKIGLIKPGCVKIVFGSPLETKDHSVDILNDNCYKWITDTVKKIGG